MVEIANLNQNYLHTDDEVMNFCPDNSRNLIFLFIFHLFLTKFVCHWLF